MVKHSWHIGRSGTADKRLIYGWHTTDIRLTYGWYTADIRLTDGWHTPDIAENWFQVFHYELAMRPIYVTGMRLTYGEYTASIQPKTGIKTKIIIHTDIIAAFCMVTNISVLGRIFGVYLPYVIPNLPNCRIPHTNLTPCQKSRLSDSICNSYFCRKI